MPRGPALLLVVAAIAACKGDPARREAASSAPPPLRTDTRCTADAARLGPGDPSHELARILAARASHESLAAQFTEPPATPDELVRALFPAARDKPLVDRRPPAPPPYTGRIDDDFAPLPIPFPADWAADPVGDVSWQLWFQSLTWLHRVDLDTAAYAVVDFVDNALFAEPPLRFAWRDHSMAVRLRAVSELAERYVNERAELDRTVMRALAVVVVTQVLGLASTSCYTLRHNHGLSEDVELAELLPRFAALRDAGRLRALALARARDQVVGSAKPDGVHIENSPHYQAYEASLALRALAASRTDGSDGDPDLRAVSSRLLAVLVQLVQPNLTLPQFGDTTNVDRTGELAELVARGRELGIDGEVIAELEWIVTRGARGTRPRATDAVFAEGGYAAFRSGWSTDDQAVTAHFRTGHWARTHYHPDDTGIEIYGHGTELIVGPGVHGYDARDRYVPYQYAPAAQNVLVVDELASVDGKPHDRARITAHGGSGDLVWVQGTNPNYQGLGVELVRTFAYLEPDAFVVVDHVVARGGEHRYAQHFRLHPRLTAVRASGATVLARTADGRGPAITLTAPGAEAALGDGWYFAKKYQPEPATDVAFHRRDGRGQLALPVLILVSPPGARPAAPVDLSYTEADGQLALRWRQGGKRRVVEVPLPAITTPE